MKLKIIKAFTWAHSGVELEQFDEGQEIETEDQDLIAVSVSEGWAESDDKPKRKKAEK